MTAFLESPVAVIVNPRMIRNDDTTQGKYAGPIIQHGRWAPATIRQYRRGIETYIVATVPDVEKRARLLTLVSRPPRARQNGEKRTSAKKARVITEAEAQILVSALLNLRDRDAQILALICSIGAYVGLRPGEWTSAAVRGDWLIVKNGKATNGRANGEVRMLLLEKLDPRVKTHVARLCMLMRGALREAGTWKKLLQRLGSRLARVCTMLGLRRLCLYAARGTVVARLKSGGARPVEIAAMLGHGSSATAFRHYPSARHAKGWQTKIHISPHPNSITQVRDTYRDFRADNLMHERAGLRLC